MPVTAIRASRLEFEAQVIAAYGRHLLVRDSAGASHEARPFGRRVQAVCGDRVICERDAHHGETHVTKILPRRSTLARATLRGTAEPIVANLDLLVTVFAPLPKPDPFIIDRYLCAASSAGMAALVLLNKADLLESTDSAVNEWHAWLAAYRAAGYETLTVSSHSPSQLAALRSLLANRTSAFVGQSGVGKSSLIAALAPTSEIATGALDKTEEGRHTTTASRLYDLPDGGALIDSPVCATMHRRSIVSNRTALDFQRWINSRRAVSFSTAVTYVNRAVPYARPLKRSDSIRVDTRAIEDCVEFATS